MKSKTVKQDGEGTRILRRVRLALAICMTAAIASIALANESGDGEILLQSALSETMPAGATIHEGQWRADKDSLTQTDQTTAALLIVGDPNWNDFAAHVQVRIPKRAQGIEAGLAARVSDPGNYVVFSLIEKKGGLYAVLRIETSAGINYGVNAPYLPVVKLTTLTGDQQRLGIDPATWHKLRLDVHGTAFVGYVDGRHVVDYDFTTSQPSYTAHPPLWTINPDRGRLALLSNHGPARFRNLEVRRLTDVSHIVTPQSGLRDAQGNLLPRQSYAETLRQNAAWLLQCNQVIEKEMAPASRRNLEPFILAIDVFSSDDGLNFDVGEFAFNSATFISGAVQYYLFSGDPRLLKKAEQIADWGIANSTPPDWKLPYLPPSIVQWQADGSWRQLSDYDKWGLEPDKAPYMGEAYLRLYGATGEKRYLEASRRIAQTIVKIRLPEGNWPFRVDPRTGKMNYLYTHSQLWYIRFFDRLAEITGETQWKKYRDDALQWMLANPVKTNKWIGLYGDISAGSESFDQWVPLEFAQYLIDHREGHPDYVDIATRITDWVSSKLVVTPGFHEGVPGIVEQSSYRVVLTHHVLRLAETYAVLWGCTREPRFKKSAIDIANSVTWQLMSDGKIRFGFWHHAQDAHLRYNAFPDQFTRIMAEIPETAPRGKDHLLHANSTLRQIHYGRKTISYETFSAGREVLCVRAKPASIKSGGRSLPELDAIRRAVGWQFDPETNLLRIAHQDPTVKISF